MKQLTIGLVCPYNYQITGGVQEHTRNLGSGLINLGHKVIYISPSSDADALPSPHITIGSMLRVPTPNGSWAEISYPIHTQVQIQKLIQKYNINILHFHELLVPMSSWAWLKASTVPTIATYHTGWTKQGMKNKYEILLRLIQNQITPYLDKSITVSNVATASNAIILKNNEVIPPSINIASFKTASDRPQSYNSNNINLVYIGRLDARKGARHIIPALARIPSKLLSRTVLHIIGSGPEMASIKLLINQYSLNQRVIFHGKKSGALRNPYLQYADVCILPTTHGESFGMVLIESLAAGCPIIAGNNSAYQLTLKDYPHQQYIIDPKNPDQLAKAITSLVTNKKHQQEIKKWAKSFVSQFSPKNIAKKHLKIYEQMLANQQPELKNDQEHKISFYDQGDISKPAFIVLHGHRSDAKRMLPLSQAISVNNRVLTPDLPGSGNSPCLVKNSIDNIAQATASWINSLHLKNYSLVGLSMGGMVSIRMLKYLHKKPTRLYLYGTPTDSNELTPNNIQHGIMLLLQRWQYGTKVATKTAETVIKHTLVMKALYRIWYPFMDSTTRNFEIDQWRSQKPKALIETIHDIITHPLSDEPISNIPTIYISAHHDNYLKSKLVRKHVKAILPNTKFVTIKLNVHVPKGPLTPKFFQPFIKTIIENN